MLVWGIGVAVAAVLFVACRTAIRRALTTRAVHLAARVEPVPASLQSGLRAALGDPTATVTVGGAVRPAGADRYTVAVGHSDALPPLLIEMHPRMRRRRALVDAVLGTAGPALENARLLAAHDAELSRVRAARHDLAAAALATRHRMERALHDGAQQALLATAAQAEVAAIRTAGNAEVSPALADAASEVRAAHAALRRVAGSAFPPLLEAAGPVAALTALAERSPMAVRVSAAAQRCDPAAEAAAYFATADVLGALSRPGGPTEVDVVLEAGPSAVRVAVHHGRVSLGPGMRMLVSDRLAAFDGRVRFADDGCVLEVPCR